MIRDERILKTNIDYMNHLWAEFRSNNTRNRRMEGRLTPKLIRPLIFTDGSKSEIGCEQVSMKKNSLERRAFKFPDDCSIFQCEVFAIDKDCEYMRQLGKEDKRIAICVDSQAVFKALTSPVVKSKVVCIQNLNEIIQNNILKLTYGYLDPVILMVMK